ncbi:sulfotransferase [Sphingomonas sp.]|uniref:tetratricopeptide repeat-containing sulfotransferase family protein n=1 Tax=Sphingomonas sp. TaxID=28214 RepID=UPI003B3B2E51
MPSPDVELADAEAAIAAGRLKEAYALLQPRLARRPDDAPALVLMAAVARRMGRAHDAVRMLARATELAPHTEPAWHQLADTLHHLPPATALVEVGALRARHPNSVGYRNLEAAMLERAGRPEKALAAFEAMRAGHPTLPGPWVSSGHLLRSLGRFDEAATAYLDAIVLDPRRGEAWWGLSELRAYRFDAAHRERMAALLADPTLPAGDRVFLHFTLGAADEAAGDHAASFRHYAEGNRLHRAGITHDPGLLHRECARAEAVFTEGFFDERAGWGCSDPAPIFIVGLPRSGSTLVEQILASHPAIEATMELNELPALARQIATHTPGTAPAGYPEALGALSRGQVAALGEAYLERTRILRRGGRPRFIDKLPANFRLVGLIRLILPNARIVDVRRDPMANGFSLFKQLLPIGHSFASDLSEIGAYQSDYRKMMALWDARLPGHVHRLCYETLVADLEGETRRLLDYLGLPFDPACLTFHDTQRQVRTPSASQVRRPIDPAAVDRWRDYERWLEPLRAALS